MRDERRDIRQLVQGLTPEQWAAYLRVVTEVPPELAAYRALETIDFPAASGAMRQAAAAEPLPAVPSLPSWS